MLQHQTNTSSADHNAPDNPSSLCKTDHVLHKSKLTPTQREGQEAARALRASIAAQAEAREAARLSAIKPEPVEEKPPEPKTRPFNVKEVAAVTAKHFDLPTETILADIRLKHCVYARHIAMYLCYTELHRSYPYIGRHMGDRDHTSVMNGHKKIKAAILAGDSQTIEHVNALAALVRAGVCVTCGRSA